MHRDLIENYAAHFPAAAYVTHVIIGRWPVRNDCHYSRMMLRLLLLNDDCAAMAGLSLIIGHQLLQRHVIIPASAQTLPAYYLLGVLSSRTVNG